MRRRGAWGAPGSVPSTWPADPGHPAGSVCMELPLGPLLVGLPKFVHPAPVHGVEPATAHARPVTEHAA